MTSLLAFGHCGFDDNQCTCRGTSDFVCGHFTAFMLLQPLRFGCACSPAINTPQLDSLEYSRMLHSRNARVRCWDQQDAPHRPTPPRTSSLSPAVIDQSPSQTLRKSFLRSRLCPGKPDSPRPSSGRRDKPLQRRTEGLAELLSPLIVAAWSWDKLETKGWKLHPRATAWSEKRKQLRTRLPFRSFTRRSVVILTPRHLQIRIPAVSP